MKVEQLLTEHKKGVKAVKYSKKPQPLVGPEAQKKKAKVKTAPPKTELEKHSKLKTTLEGKEKLSAQEKFKRGVKRAGYDMDAGAKRIEDLLAKQKKEREQREKQEKDMKEAKQPEAPKPRNFVAKNAKTVGAGKHKDAKKAAKEVRGQKHKNKEMAEGMERAVDAKGRTQSQWMKLVKAKYPDAKIQQAKMIDGPCQATLSDGRKLSWTKVQQGVAEGKWDPFTGGDYGQTPRPQRVRQDSQDSNTAEPDEEKDQAEWEAMLDYYGTNVLVQRALEDLYKQTHGGGYHDSVETPDRYLATIESSTTGKREKKYFPNKQAAYKYAKGTLGYVVSIEKIDTTEDDSDLITLPVILGLGQQKKKWMLQFPDERYAQKWAFKHKNVATIMWEVGHNLEKEVTEAEMAENAMGKVVDYKPGVSATIDTGPGMTTMLDLKKNPTSLTKDPSTGKLKLMPGPAATAQPSATTQSTVKPGDQVEMPKTNTMAAEDILRLAGLR